MQEVQLLAQKQVREWGVGNKAAVCSVRQALRQLVVQHASAWVWRPVQEWAWRQSSLVQRGGSRSLWVLGLAS